MDASNPTRKGWASATVCSLENGGLPVALGDPYCTLIAREAPAREPVDRQVEGCRLLVGCPVYDPLEMQSAFHASQAVVHDTARAARAPYRDRATGVEPGLRDPGGEQDARSLI